jgi:hypothetical protein
LCGDRADRRNSVEQTAVLISEAPRPGLRHVQSFIQQNDIRIRPSS